MKYSIQGKKLRCMPEDDNDCFILGRISSQTRNTLEMIGSNQDTKEDGSNCTTISYLEFPLSSLMKLFNYEQSPQIK